MHCSTYLSLTQIDFWSGINLPADQIWWSAIRKWKLGRGASGGGGGGGDRAVQQSWVEWAAKEEEAAASKGQLTYDTSE